MNQKSKPKTTFKKGEYAIFLDENTKYLIDGQVHNKLEIESKCVKKNGVYDCLAAKSDSLPKSKTVEVGFGNHHPAVLITVMKSMKELDCNRSQSF